jgi:hypothetical protein
VQQHQRITVTAFVVPRVHAVDLDVASHRLLFPSRRFMG